MRPFIESRKFLTEGVGTPGHVIPINGNLVNWYPKSATVSGRRFDSARVVERGGTHALLNRTWSSGSFLAEARISIFPARGDGKPTQGIPQPQP